MVLRRRRPSTTNSHFPVDDGPRYRVRQRNHHVGRMTAPSAADCINCEWRASRHRSPIGERDGRPAEADPFGWVWGSSPGYSPDGFLFLPLPALQFCAAHRDPHQMISLSCCVASPTASRPPTSRWARCLTGRFPAMRSPNTARDGEQPVHLVGVYRVGVPAPAGERHDVRLGDSAALRMEDLPAGEVLEKPVGR